MELFQDLIIESKKHYTFFLEQIVSSLGKNLDATLDDKRANLIEDCYFKAISFSSWQQILLTPNKENCSEIYNELQSDLASSMLSALTGNYRLALISIRSFIELSYLFTYYYYHPIEYNWWLDDNHVIKFSELNQNYYSNYKQLNTFNVNSNIYKEWKKVSKYVHAEFKNYMQSYENLTSLPVYQKGKLGQWITHFSKATIYINQLFYIVFQDTYFEAIAKVEYNTSCQIIKNILDESLFTAIKESRLK